ncbi:hypothetical protein U9M48_019293 [Paspalum notatum var. saurae]|uniref:Uncharacterized protein n=1 Tax=Paspalum notatum var. saurae TaxID=547442 RepID=A0AAQ3WR34_PASNO
MAVGEILHGSSCQATNSPGASFLLGVLSCPSVAAPLLSKQQQHQRTTCSTKFRNGLAPLLSMQDTATGHHGFALLQHLPVVSSPPLSCLGAQQMLEEMPNEPCTTRILAAHPAFDVLAQR